MLGVPFSVVEYVDGRVIRSRSELDGLSDAEVVSCAFGLVDVFAEFRCGFR